MDMKSMYWMKTKNNIQGFIDHMYININPYP